MRYSKRYVAGLPSPKEIVVKDLAAYMALFSSKKFTNYVYRGEPTNYHNTISSAFRGKEYPFIQMKDEFKREVFHRLTLDERNDFLAFSQHHGIPTNLIDFTRSPLVAMFFACQPFSSDDDRFDKARGFIYLLKNDLIDITDLLSGHEDDNFLNRFIWNDDDLVINLYKKFASFEKRYPETFYRYFKQLNDDWQYYFVDMQPPHPKRSRFPQYANGEYKEKIKYEYLSQYTEIVQKIQQRELSAECAVLQYTLKLREFLQQILITQETVWWLNCIPNFLYTPYLSFERGRNQQGLFVYQAYLSFYEQMFHAHILSLQRVWIKVIIVFENKEKILRELDFMGINEKFIYGDYDNIAKYIKRKYEK